MNERLGLAVGAQGKCLAKKAVEKPTEIPGDRLFAIAPSENPEAFPTHSLRRTKVALIYKKIGNLRGCQLLLGHGKLESTVR